MSKQLIERKERGRLMAQANGLVKRNSETSYTVSSQYGNGSYDVNAAEYLREQLNMVEVLFTNV